MWDRGLVLTPRDVVRARKAARLNQQQLATLLGVSKRTVWNWENVHVPEDNEDLIRRHLGRFLEAAEGGTPLSAYSDAQLLADLAGLQAELGRRLAELRSEGDSRTSDAPGKYAPEASRQAGEGFPGGPLPSRRSEGDDANEQESNSGL